MKNEKNGNNAIPRLSRTKCSFVSNFMLVRNEDILGEVNYFNDHCLVLGYQT